ncbi:hypothetical protein [Streptomyces sp. NPDC052811]|uniref:hypothetical protein n=1 Tax=Streptomyces sp. NPDC052811 TaxID=3155731 RepID=UPI00344151DE
MGGFDGTLAEDTVSVAVAREESGSAFKTFAGEVPGTYCITITGLPSCSTRSYTATMRLSVQPVLATGYTPDCRHAGQDKRKVTHSQG